MSSLVTPIGRKLTVFSLEFLLWNDNLCRFGIVGPRNRVGHDTDATRNLTHFLHLVREVGRIANDKVTLGNLRIVVQEDNCEAAGTTVHT